MPNQQTSAEPSEQLSSSRPEDLLFEEYRKTGLESTLEELLRHLRRHGLAITYQQFGEPKPGLVNAALAKAIRSFDKFRGEAKFSTWFHQIVLNLCRDYWKNSQGEFEHGIYLADISASDGFSLAIKPPMGTKLMVEQQLERLSPEERQLAESYMAGLTGDEIAEELGTTPENVRVKWHRLRKKLREALS